MANKSLDTALTLKVAKEVRSRSLVCYPKIRIFDYTKYAYVNDGKLEPRAKIRCSWVTWIRSRGTNCGILMHEESSIVEMLL